MPVGPAPCLDRHQRSRQTALGRPLPHHLLSILRLRPDMGEAEKVERRCLAVWMRATLALGAEVDEARLVRMEREPVPIKPLSQHFQNPFGVVVALERHHEVISKPHRQQLYVAIGDPGVIDVFDTTTMERTASVPTEKGAHTTALAPGGDRLYAFLPATHRAAIYQVS